jgi:hypothetical protein
MELAIKIEDKIYQEAIKTGVDIQEEFNSYLKETIEQNQLKNYLNSKEFIKDKEYFHQILKEVEDGTAELIDHEQFWDEIDKSLK